MGNALKNLAWIIVAVITGYVIWKVYRAFFGTVRTAINTGHDWSAGFDAVSNFVGNEFSAAKDLPSEVYWTAKLPFLASDSKSLTATNFAEIGNDYAPGGSVYNRIASASGVAAADSAWARVQSDYSATAAQDSAWWKIWQ